MKISSFSIKSVLVLLVSLLFINTSFSQDRKINKALEYIQSQKYDDAEEIIKGLQKKNATYAATYYVQSMLYGSKAFKRYNIDSCYIFYNKAIDAFRTLDIKEQTEICIDFKLCLSNAQNTKDSIAGVAYSEYRSYQKIDKMVAFNNLYKGTSFIQLSNELIEELYYGIALNKNTTEGYLDFLDMYPSSIKKDKVTKQIHKIEYDLVVTKNEKIDYQNYLTKYPTSIFCAEIRKNIERLDYSKTKISLEISDFEEFMDKYPNSSYAQEILVIYETLYYNDAIKKRVLSQLNKFKIMYPTSKYISELNTTICDVTFENVKLINKIDAYKEFVKSYPNSKYDKEAKNKIEELFPIVPKLLINGKYIYIDKFTGIDLFRNEYDKVTLFQNSQAIVMQNSKYGVIDEKGRKIVPFQYDEVTRCTNPDLYLVKINNKMNVFNNEGRQLLKADSDIQLSEQNNDFMAFNNLGKEYRYGPSDYVFRIVNKELVKYVCPYDYIPYFDSNGLAIVSKGKSNDSENSQLGLYGIVNKDFQEIISLKYSYIENIDGYSDLYIVNLGGSITYRSDYPLDGKWGVINTSRNVLIPLIYDKLESINMNNNLFFKVNKGWVFNYQKPLPGSYGIIDINGREIIPFDYQEIKKGEESCLIVNKGGEVLLNNSHTFVFRGRWGVVDFYNKIKIPIIYSEIEFYENRYRVRIGAKNSSIGIFTDGKVGLMVLNKIIINPSEYNYLECIGKYIFVTSGGKLTHSENGVPYFDGEKWGVYNESGKLILNMNFDQINTTKDSNLILLSLYNKYNKKSYLSDFEYIEKTGLSDNNGKLILPIKFEKIEVTSELIFAKYNGKYQIYTKTGELILDSRIDAISELENNFISYRIGEKNGILKPDGSELFPPRFWATKNEYSNDISLEGPYFRIEEAGQYFYATDKGEVFKEY